MRYKSIWREHGLQPDYSQFSNPFFGLACMIFVQAAVDYAKLGEKEFDSDILSSWSKTDIALFFRSDWAEFLATSIGTNAIDLFRALEGQAAA